MNRKVVAISALSIAALGAHAESPDRSGQFAHRAASSAEKTRQEVRLETLRAIHNGDIIVGGELGLKARDLNPGAYAAPPVVAGKSRQEVREETRQAILDGDIAAAGELGLTARELNPRAYPARPVVAGKSRQEVREETLRAIRDGDIPLGGELGWTARQVNPQYYERRDSAQRHQTAKQTTRPNNDQ